MPTAAGFREFSILLPKQECNFFMRVVAFFQTQMPSLFLSTFNLVSYHFVPAHANDSLTASIRELLCSHRSYCNVTALQILKKT